VIVNALRFQEHIFNELYPRQEPWNENFALDIPPKSITELISLKVQKNSFEGKNNIIIGNNISYFNHSNIPNAHIVKEEIVLDKLDINCIFLIVVATTKIKPEKEIYIKYSDGIDFENNLCIPEMSFVFDYEKRHKKIKSIVDKYIKTYMFKLVIRNQIANHHGLFMSNNLIMPAQRFITYMNEMCDIDVLNHKDPVAVCERWLECTYNNISRYYP
jgi:hypothetical protein